MKWSIFTTILLSFILIAICLYWFAIRPSIIKHDCSWIKKHADAIPAREGLTEKELKNKGMIKLCPIEPPQQINESNFNYMRRVVLSEEYSCNQKNEDIISKNKPQKYVPTREWYEKATTQQYQFCLHDKGL